jgi:hypothetical protein
MHAVVNHLRLKEPLPRESVDSFDGAAQAVLDAGGLACHLVRVDETHLILVLFFASAADAERVARDVGGPWVREHVAPYLAAGTERYVGEALVSRP